MARHSAKTIRTPPVTSKRTVLERWGSRVCAGYEVTVKIDATQTSSLGRASRVRGTGERE
jgi:hypothetical protein